MTKEYLKYTGYKRCVDLKKLDFMVQSLQISFDNKDVKGLDLGCGEGNVTIPLASLGYRMVGIDISEEEIEKAKSKRTLPDNPMFYVGDVENFASDETFDFVVCSEVLEHVERPGVVLSLINRVLRKKGPLIVTVPNGFGIYSLLHDSFRNKIVYKISPKVGRSAHVQAFTLAYITNLIEEAGFEVLQIRHSDFISFLPFLNKSDKVCFWDCKLADKLSHFMVSGWYIWCKKV